MFIFQKFSTSYIACKLPFIIYTLLLSKCCNLNFFYKIVSFPFMRAMSQRNVEILTEFIEIVKSEPCLWKIKSDDYHIRDKRDAAYRKLTAKLREIHPNADDQLVKKKK